jgi:hypothetical protein
MGATGGIQRFELIANLRHAPFHRRLIVLIDLEHLSKVLPNRGDEGSNLLPLIGADLSKSIRKFARQRPQSMLTLAKRLDDLLPRSKKPEQLVDAALCNQRRLLPSVAQKIIQHRLLAVKYAQEILRPDRWCR